MRAHRLITITAVLIAGCAAATADRPVALAQSRATEANPMVANYQRAMGLRDKYDGLAVDVAEPPRWIERSSRFWYRKSVKGGNQFIIVNADTQARGPAFDHDKLAAGLSTASGRKYTGLKLPFSQFTFVDGDKAIQFTPADPRGTGPPAGAAAAEDVWRCALDTYVCSRPEATGRGGRGGRGGGGLGGPVRPVADINAVEAKKSPDGKLEAVVNNYNIGIREVGKPAVTLLSSDGSEGGFYDPESVVWSPDSRRLAAFKVRPGFRRYVHYVESSPEDQLQPKHSSL